MIFENLRMALLSLKANKLRSFLTMLGIIIGIGAVIAIVSIGDTMRTAFTDIYQNIGSTMAYLMPAPSDEGMGFDLFNADDVRQIRARFGDELSYIDTGNALTLKAQRGRKVMNITLNGADSDFQTVQPVKILHGRYLSPEDVLERRANVLLSKDTALQFFGQENAVGRSFRAQQEGSGIQEYRVIGIYEKNESTLQKLLMGGNKGRGEGVAAWTLMGSSFQLRYFGRADMDQSAFSRLSDQLIAYVCKLKGGEPKDWSSYSVMEEMKQVDQVLGGMSAAVGGIAAISLLVGGIGIMNIMMVSVTERTREIGIRKALGATTGDIMLQFLIESAVLSASGGIIGIALALGLVSLGASAFGMTVVVKPAVVLIAVVFSAVVGIFFGIFPARKAAKADPIVALRYE